jgi:hypothetical protein
MWGWKGRAIQFVNLGTRWGKWSVSRPGRFKPWKVHPEYTLNMRPSWPSTGLDTLQTRKIPRTCRRWKHNPQCSRCTTSAIRVRLRRCVLLNLDSFLYATTSSTVTTLGRMRFMVLCIWQLKTISMDLQHHLNTHFIPRSGMLTAGC